MVRAFGDEDVPIEYGVSRNAIHRTEKFHGLVLILFGPRETEGPAFSCEFAGFLRHFVRHVIKVITGRRGDADGTHIHGHDRKETHPSGHRPRRRCAYAAAPIGSVRGAQVMTTPDAAFLVIDVVTPDGKATGIPTRPGALARSVWTLRVPDPAKADRFAGMVARHAPAKAVPLDRAPRTDRRPVLLIAVAAMLAASLAVLGGWTAYEAGQPEPVRTKVVKRTVVKERVRTVTSCPTPAPPTAQGQAPAATAEPETDAAPQSQPAQSDDSQSQSQSTDTDSGTHDDGRNQTQEGESDVSGAEGSQAGQ